MGSLILTNKKYVLVGVALLILAVALFYLISDIRNSSLDFLLGAGTPVRQLLGCDPGMLDESVLTARKEKTEDIRLLVHFSEKPSPDVREFLMKQGVNIYLNTWIYDYLIADATVDRLCFLADLPGITNIRLGE